MSKGKQCMIGFQDVVLPGTSRRVRITVTELDVEGDKGCEKGSGKIGATYMGAHGHRDAGARSRSPRAAAPEILERGSGSASAAGSAALAPMPPERDVCPTKGCGRTTWHAGLVCDKCWREVSVAARWEEHKRVLLEGTVCGCESKSSDHMGDGGCWMGIASSKKDRKAFDAAMCSRCYKNDCSWKAIDRNVYHG